MSQRTAVEVRNDRDNGRLIIKWDDGLRLQYPFDDLRNACPCAECRGHSPGEVEPPQVSGVALQKIEEVGAYALRFSGPTVTRRVCTRGPTFKTSASPWWPEARSPDDSQEDQDRDQARQNRQGRNQKKATSTKRASRARASVEPPEPLPPPEAHDADVDPADGHSGRPAESSRSLDVLPMVVALLDADEAESRRAAAVVLGALALEDGAALAALRKACRRGDDPMLRARAAEALGALAPASLVHDLMPLLKDPDATVRETVRKVLASGRGLTAGDIDTMLSAKDERSRVGAIAVLGAIGTEEARVRILDQLEDESTRIWEAVQDGPASSVRTSRRRRGGRRRRWR